MTLRRRVFVGTLVIAGGIWAFQPAMRSRMEKRLSDIFGTKVEIGFSKISLSDGTIAMRDIVVRPSTDSGQSDRNKVRTPIKIEHAALRFDWGSLRFRNLEIETLVAKGVEWNIIAPGLDEVPCVDSKDNASEHLLRLSNESQINLSESLEVVVRPIKASVIEEATKQGRSHSDLSSQIKQIADRLVEFASADAAPNPLRDRAAILEVKRNLALIRQKIAEDRIAGKDREKLLGSLKQTAQQNLVDRIELMLKSEANAAQQTAVQLARACVAEHWNRNRPFVHAMVQTMGLLQTTEEGKTAISRNRSVAYRAQPSSSLPERFINLMQGNVRGLATFPDDFHSKTGILYNFDFQIENLSSKHCSEAAKPKVTLAISETRPTQNNQGDGVSLLTCTAERIEISQSDKIKSVILIERRLDKDKLVTTRIQKADHGWSSTIRLPAQACLEGFFEEQVPLALGKTDKDTITAQLMGSTSTINGPQNMIVEIDPDGLVALESLLDSATQNQASKQRSELGIRGSELLGLELMKISVRWDQLRDEHSRIHAGWEVKLNEINDAFERLDSSNKRTSRQLGANLSEKTR